MEIKVGFEISYAAVQPTPMVIMLSIHPSRYADIVGTERIIAEPDVPIGFYRDSFGNVCGRLVAPAGGVTLRGDALVRDSGLPDVVVPTAQQLPIDQLPDEVLQYLMPSRYCETDKLTDVAWSLFGNTPKPFGVPFEPSTHPEFGAFETAYAGTREVVDAVHH